jgi:hypothetical protein
MNEEWFRDYSPPDEEDANYRATVNGGSMQNVERDIRAVVESRGNNFEDNVTDDWTDIDTAAAEDRARQDGN